MKKARILSNYLLPNVLGLILPFIILVFFFYSVSVRQVLSKQNVQPLEDIKRIAEQSQTLPKELHQKIQVDLDDGMVTISMFRHPQSTIEDCKIDAVLLARKILRINPNNLYIVRCLFYDYDRQNFFWDLSVRSEIVTAYAEGKLTSRELLNSVVMKENNDRNPLTRRYAKVSYENILKEDSVFSGYLAEKRLAILLRLKNLGESQIDTSKLSEKFWHLEDLARRGQKKIVVEKIIELNAEIDSYTKNLVESGVLPKEKTYYRNKADLEKF